MSILIKTVQISTENSGGCRVSFEIIGMLPGDQPISAAFTSTADQHAPDRALRSALAELAGRAEELAAAARALATKAGN